MTVITRALAVLFTLSAIVAPSVGAVSISIEDRQQHARHARSGVQRLPVEERNDELAVRSSSSIPHPPCVKGVSWTMAASGLSHIKGHNVCMVYNWGAVPPTDWNKYDMQFVCQLRDGKASSIANFEKYCPHHTYWMAMNEINLPSPSGSGLSASAAAALYNKYMRAGCETDHYCVSISVTTANGALNILKQWFNDLGGVKASGIRAISVHPYDSNLQKVEAYIESVYKEFGLPIWVTETTCHAFYGSDQNCSVEQTKEFFKELMAWAKTTGYVKIVFPFGWMSGSAAAEWGVGTDIALLGSGGTPSSLGQSFLDL